MYWSILVLVYSGISDAFYFNDIFLFNTRSSLAEIATLNFALFGTISVILVLIQSSAEANNAKNEALLQAHALLNLNQMQTEFLQNLSHEMKTPLTVIQTAIIYEKRLLSKPPIDVEKAQNILETIQTQTKGISQRIDAMFEMAITQVGKNRQKIDLSPLFINAIDDFQLIARSQKNKLILDIPSELPFVFVDKDSISQVLSILLTNAMEATSHGVITLNAKSTSPFITITLTDTGVGIPENLLSRVTQRGVSGKGSSGLGLSIVQTIIHAHGGQLTIQSKVSKGTTIEFTIPVYSGQEMRRL